MGKIKEAICRSIPDEVKVNLPDTELTWKGIRGRLNCPQTEPKETCFKLTNKVKVCIVEDI
jgi:ribosomal protein L6P/L9E